MQIGFVSLPNGIFGVGHDQLQEILPLCGAVPKLLVTQAINETGQFLINEAEFPQPFIVQSAQFHRCVEIFRAAHKQGVNLWQQIMSGATQAGTVRPPDILIEAIDRPRPLLKVFPGNRSLHFFCHFTFLPTSFQIQTA